MWRNLEPPPRWAQPRAHNWRWPDQKVVINLTGEHDAKEDDVKYDGERNHRVREFKHVIERKRAREDHYGDQSPKRQRVAEEPSSSNGRGLTPRFYIPGRGEIPRMDQSYRGHYMSRSDSPDPFHPSFRGNDGRIFPPKQNRRRMFEDIEDLSNEDDYERGARRKHHYRRRPRFRARASSSLSSGGGKAELRAEPSYFKDGEKSTALRQKLYEEESAIEIEVSEDFRCPITCEVLVDPVVLSSGHTYERHAIEDWIRRGNFTDPVTGTPLEDLSMTNNKLVRTFLQELRTKERERLRQKKSKLDTSNCSEAGVKSDDGQAKENEGAELNTDTTAD